MTSAIMLMCAMENSQRRCHLVRAGKGHVAYVVPWTMSRLHLIFA